MIVSKMEIAEPFPEVYMIEVGSRKILATFNLTPGLPFYGEQLINVKEGEYRTWNPYRSKLAAVIMKGLRHLPPSRGDKVLYLGVASGTTCSHISDIVGWEGHIWAVDFAPRPMRDLLTNLARHRENISPILGNARHPEGYSSMVPMVDGLYADVAQPDQANILKKNADVFLEPGGWALMAVKSRSVDVTRSPHDVYEEQIDVLERNGFKIEEVLELDPYERDHAMASARYKV